MQTSFARDLVDPATIIEEALAERPNKPVLIRIQPSIFRLRPGNLTSSGGIYKAWRDVHWTVAIDQADEAVPFREALRVFFAQLGAYGPTRVIDALQRLTESTDTTLDSSTASEPEPEPEPVTEPEPEEEPISQGA